MAQGQVSLDFSDAVSKLKQADNLLSKMVDRVVSIQGQIQKMSDGGSLLNLSSLKHQLDYIKVEFEKISKLDTGKLVNPKEIDKAKAGIDDIVKSLNNFVNIKNGSNSKFEIFDPQSINATNKDLAGIESRLLTLYDNISKSRQRARALYDASVATNQKEFDAALSVAKKAGFKPTDYEGKDLNVQKIQAMIDSRSEDKLTKQYREERKVLTDQANFLRKTVMEQTEFILAELKKRENAELRYHNKIRSEYGKLVSERNKLDKTIEKIDKGSKDIGFTADQKRERDAMVARQQELNSKLEAIEKQHLAVVADLKMRSARETTAKIIAEEQSRMRQNYVSTPQDAIAFAQMASTVNEMREAQKHLDKVRNNVNINDTSTIKALNDEYVRLRIAIESVTRANKNENTLQPTIRNEYARLLKQIDEVVLAKQRLRETDRMKSGDADAVASYNALEAQEAELNKRRIEIEQGAQGQLDSVVIEHESLRAKKRLELFEQETKRREEIEKKRGVISSRDAENVISNSQGAQNVRQAEEAIRNLTAARDKLDKNDAQYAETVKKLNQEIARQKTYIDRITNAEQRRAQAQRLREQRAERRANSYEGAMEYAKSARSINELNTAIKRLENARANERRDTKESKKRYRDLSNELESVRRRLSRMKDESQKTNSTMKGLAGQLAKVFSIGAIKGYINQIAEVRGEFEMQHRSLQILIQDADKANEIWNKTVALAVKSPFRVKELVTYTKQLAAYRIEADKLYDTNKMLADVSAGLGVDMGRLILAYGQVKAANFLRGTELRQFSEAGVNILQHLADNFSEAEGRIVSVGEVFERVSNRMVLFEDVDKVFRQITSEGGQFYMMQEKQAETLKGMIRNLRDSLDLMLNDIGQDNEGTLKEVVRLTKIILDSWREFTPILITIGSAMVAAFSSRKIAEFSKYLTLVVKDIGRLAKGLGMVSKTNVFVALATAIVAVVIALRSANKAMDNFTAAMLRVEKDIRKQLDESIVLYKSLTEKINDANTSVLERERAYRNLNDRFKDILPNEYLQAEYISRLSNNYDEATKAMRSYYEAKAQEQKKDAINTEYTKTVYENHLPALIKKFTNVSTDVLQKSGVSEKDIEIFKGGIPSIITSVIEAAEDGEIELDNIYQSILEKTKEFFDAYNIELDTINTQTLASRIDLLLGDKFVVNNKVNKIADAIKQRDTLLGNVQGVSYSTLDEYYAGQDLNKTKESVDKLIEAYAKLNNAYSNYSKNTDKEHREKQKNEAQSIIDSITELTINNENGVQLITEEQLNILKEFNTQLQGLADKGSLEFLSGEKEIQSNFLSALNDNVGKTFEGNGENTNGVQYHFYTDADVKEAAKDTYANYQEGLDEAAKKSKNDKLQDTFIDAVKKVVSSVKGVTKDEFTNLFPDTGKSLTDLRTQISGHIESIDNLKKQYDASVKGFQTTGLSFSESQTAANNALSTSAETIKHNYEELKPALELLFTILGGVKKDTTTNNRTSSMVDEQLRIVDQMNKKFHELSKTLSREDALTGAFEGYKDAFADAFNMKGVKQMTANEFYSTVLKFPDEDEVVNFLDNMAKKAVKNEDKIKINLRKGQYVQEMEVRLSEKNLDTLKGDIDKLFSRLDLTKEMKKLNISKEWGEALFDFETISLDDIKEKVYTELSSVFGVATEGGISNVIAEVDKKISDYSKDPSGEQGQKNKIEALKEYLKKISELEAKDAKERMTEYLKYAQMSVGKRAEINLKGLEKLRAAEEAFAIKEGDSDATKATKSDMLDRATQRIKQEMEDELRDFDWNEFKQGEIYVNVFNDIERASDSLLSMMSEKIREFKDAWTDIPLEDARFLLDKLGDIEAEMARSNPFKGNKEDRNYFWDLFRSDSTFESANAQKTMDSTKGGFVNRLYMANQVELSEAQSAIDMAKEELSLIETVIKAKEEGKELDLTGNKYADKSLEALKAEAATQKNIVKEKGKTVEKSTELNNKIKANTARLKAQSEAYSNINQMATDLYGAFSELTDAMEVDSPVKDFADMGMSMAECVLQTLALQANLKAAEVGAKGLGAAMNTAMGVIGWIVMAVQLIAQAVSAVVKYQKELIQQKIDRYAAQVEELTKRYDKLAEKMGEAFSIYNLREYTNQMSISHKERIHNLENEIKAYEEFRKVQKALRGNYRAQNSDEYKSYLSAIEQLEELKETYEQHMDDAFSHATNGILDSAHEAANGFVDAWYDAFKETGEGLSGLEDNFDEMMTNLVKRQASLSIVGQYAEKWSKALRESMDKNGNALTKADAEAFATMVREDLPKLDSSLTTYFEAMKDVIDQSDNTNISGLQKGIQGMSESTADILAAYFNSIRAYTASIDEKMDSVVRNLSVTSEDNPMTIELRKHTEMLRSIRTMMEDVMRSNSPYAFNVRMLSI